MSSETSGRERGQRRGVDTQRRAASCVVALAVAAPALACRGPPGAGRRLRTDLGTFSVDAERDLNECGPNAVGNPRELTFDVELARDEGELFWDGNGGTLGSRLDFELTASVRVELRAPRGADAGCSVVRDDRIAGVLAEDEVGSLTSFEGEMEFDFAATRESTCTLDEQDAADLPLLPCRMRYLLSGRRTRAPMP
ncbi:MAG TPA: hypothetical protein VMG12_35900 [Polyangiaceae bacterium]|nr:hypothetical protein [Polyangiaceae bacterium]